MHLQFAFLKSKVAKQIFFLFVIAAIIPVSIIGALSYNYVTSLLTKQKQEHIAAASKSYGMAIYDRILNAENQFISLSKNILDTTDIDISSTADTRIRLDSNVLLFSDMEIYLKPSNIDSADLKHLLEGKSKITISRNSNNIFDIYFTRMLNTIESSRLLTAKVDSKYIYGDMDDFAGEEDACIVVKNKGTLNCSNNKFNAISKSSFENNEEGERITQSMRINNTNYIYSSWELFLHGRFKTDSWLIFYAQPSTVVFAPIKAFTSILLPTLVLAILLVSLVSLNQIAKILIPLETLTSITKRIAKRDFSKKAKFTSNDEFQTLGESFNDMSSELSKQFSMLTAMSDLDRSILSSKDTNNMVEAIFQFLNFSIDHKYLGAVIMDTQLDEVGYLHNYDPKSNNNVTTKNTLQILPEDQSILFNHSNKLTNISSREHLAKIDWLNNIDSPYFSFLPIRQEEKLLGIIIIGYNQIPSIENEEANQLEKFTGRVAVALSAAKREQKLLFQANYDDLTGLPNRQLLITRLKNAIYDAKHNDSQVAFLFIDLDRFKVINDSQGHATGDKLLIAAGDRIKTCVRAYDTVARYGGDEFAVILPTINNAKNASSTAEEIIKRLSEVFYIDNYEQIIGASIGISVFPQDGNTWDELLQKADIAMYKTKQKEPGKHLFFTDTMQEDIRDKAKLEADLFHAIERKELHLVYQPQIGIQSGDITGAESLLRWTHGKKGPIGPDQFIPFAEESGFIVTLGAWAMREAIKQCQKWQAEGQALPKIAVNISARQLRHENFMSNIETLISDFDIEATSLEFEITESLFLSDDKHTLDMLHQINQFGISIAIDDFGKGYSSLSYLKKLPTQTLKIDKLFIKDLNLGDDSIAITKAIIAMGKALNKIVVAEGVETLEQLNILKDLGCDRAQGYYISKPKVASEFMDYSKTAIIQLDNIRSGRKIA